MPIQNDDTLKIETTTEVFPNVSDEIKTLAPVLELEKDDNQRYEDYENPDDYYDDGDLPFSEVKFFLKEEDYYSKLGRKFVARGYKRPETEFRSDTRRKYKNFRETKKIERRTDEKFLYRNSHGFKDLPSATQTAQTAHLHTPATVPITATATTNSTAVNPVINNTVPTDTDDKKYLSTNQELEYQEQLRRSAVVVQPTTGISLQQLLDICNRDLTPEDYELLLRLDEMVEKKTVKQETLSSLSETSVDSESQCSELCTVCMCNYGMGEKIKTLPCKHFFHVDCIVPYLSSYGQSCPVCKAPV